MPGQAIVFSNRSIIDEDIAQPHESIGTAASIEKDDPLCKMLELARMMKDALLAIREMTSALLRHSLPEPAGVNKSYMWKVLASILDRLFFLIQTITFVLCCVLFYPNA